MSSPEAKDSEPSGGEELFRIGEAQRGARLDVVLRDLLGLSRLDVAELFAAHAVALVRNGRKHRCKKGDQAELGDELTVRLEQLSRAEPDPTIQLPVLALTNDYVAVDKPAGLPSGARRGSSRGNAASGLLAKFPEIWNVGFHRLEPGLLHRLDTWTSGILIAARSPDAFEELRRHWTERRLEKRYLAVVTTAYRKWALGEMAEQTSDLGPDPEHPGRVQMTPGKRFVTEARCLAAGQTRALLEVRAGSAYRHQVRIHLASLDAPLVGDAVYDSPDLEGQPRHALHAHYVAWESGEPVKSPAPPDFRALFPEGDGDEFWNF